MKNRNYLKSEAAGYLAAALIVVGGAMSTAMAVPSAIIDSGTYGGLVVSGTYNYESATDAAGDNSKASVALYNALAGAGAAKITGTGIAVSGSSSLIAIQNEVRQALRGEDWTKVVAPAIKAAVAEFPGAPERFVSYVLSQLAYTTTDAGGVDQVVDPITTNKSSYSARAADVVKNAIEGLRVVAPESAYTNPSLDGITAIVGEASRVVANRLASNLPAPDEKAVAANKVTIIKAINALVKQGVTSGLAAFPSATNADRWAVAAEIAAASAGAGLDDNTLLNSARKGTIAAAAMNALPVGLQAGSAALVMEKVVATGGVDANEFTASVLVTAPKGSAYNVAVKGVALNASDDAARLEFVRDMIASKVASAPVVRAAAEVYTAGSVALIAGIGGASNSNMTAPVVYAVAAGVASANVSDAAAVINAATPLAATLLKAKQDRSGNATRNTAAIATATAVIGELVLSQSGSAAETAVSDLLNDSLLSEAGTGKIDATYAWDAKLNQATMLKSVNQAKVDLAKSVAVAAAGNPSALKGALGAIADTMSGTSQDLLKYTFTGAVITGTTTLPVAEAAVTRAQFATAVISKVAAKPVAVSEVARVVSTTGFGGALAGGDVPAFANSVIDSIAADPARVAFAAGLIGVYDGQSSAITTKIVSKIVKTNKNMALYANSVVGNKDEAGDLTVDDAAIHSMLTLVIPNIAIETAPSRVVSLGVFASSMATAVPSKAALTVKDVALSVAGFPDRGLIVGTAVKALKANVGTVREIVEAVVSGTVPEKKEFLASLIKTAGATAAIQQASEKVIATVLTSGSSLPVFINGVVTTVGSSASIDKIAAGAAMALKLSGSTNQEVANLFTGSGTNSIVSTAALAAKFAAASVVAVPDAAVKIAVTLSKQAPLNNSATVAFAVKERGAIAGNAAGSYGSAVNIMVTGSAALATATSVNVDIAENTALHQNASNLLVAGTTAAASARAYPAIAVGIASGVIDGMDVTLGGEGLPKTSTTPDADKATVIGYVIKAIAPYHFTVGGDVIDQVDAVVKYSLASTSSSGVGYDRGAGFDDAQKAAFLVAQATTVATAVGTADVLASKVVSNLGLTAGSGLNEFGKNIVLGNKVSGITAPATLPVVKAIFNGIATGAGLDATTGAAFASNVITDWATTLDTKLVPVKTTAPQIAGIAAGIGQAVGLVEVAEGISSNTNLLNAFKPAVAAAMAAVNPKQALGIVQTFAKYLPSTGDFKLNGGKNAAGGYLLADMANQVAAAVSAAKGGLLKNVYEEMASIGSAIVIGYQSGDNALSGTALQDLIADVTLNVIKAKTASAYEVAGAMLATAQALGLTASDTMSSILTRMGGSPFIAATLQASVGANMTKALNALGNAIDNFNVGPITTHETCVVNG